MVFGERRFQTGKMISSILAPNVGHISMTYCQKERRKQNENSKAI